MRAVGRDCCVAWLEAGAGHLLVGCVGECILVFVCVVRGAAPAGSGALTLRDPCAADYFQELYDFAVRLIKLDKAFICHETKEDMAHARDLRRAGTPGSALLLLPPPTAWATARGLIAKPPPVLRAGMSRNGATGRSRSR